MPVAFCSHTHIDRSVKHWTQKYDAYLLHGTESCSDLLDTHRMISRCWLELRVPVLLDVNVGPLFAEPPRRARVMLGVQVTLVAAFLRGPDPPLGPSNKRSLERDRIASSMFVVL